MRVSMMRFAEPSKPTADRFVALIHLCRWWRLNTA
jgi:hypothetical protein